MLISLLTALSGRLGLCARPLLVSAKSQMPENVEEQDRNQGRRAQQNRSEKQGNAFLIHPDPRPWFSIIGLHPPLFWIKRGAALTLWPQEGSLALPVCITVPPDKNSVYESVNCCSEAYYFNYGYFVVNCI